MFPPMVKPDGYAVPAGVAFVFVRRESFRPVIQAGRDIHLGHKPFFVSSPKESACKSV